METNVSKGVGEHLLPSHTGVYLSAVSVDEALSLLHDGLIVYSSTSGDQQG